MLIIDKPTMYENIDNSSSNKSLASSVIVGAVQKAGSTSTLMNISLYFTVLSEYKPNVTAKYLCSFYDTNSLRWNESGCTEPTYDSIRDRYGCSCNHLTSFALIWLPQGSALLASDRLSDQQILHHLFFNQYLLYAF